MCFIVLYNKGKQMVSLLRILHNITGHLFDFVNSVWKYLFSQSMESMRKVILNKIKSKQMILIRLKNILFFHHNTALVKKTQPGYEK